MAAGLGFKTFNTGDVLSAADVNGYLMQGVLVFASTAARDAAITAPAEGQFAFTKDTNSLFYYDGAAWVASGATGDIEGVTAGVGISGGGTSGTVTVTNSMATAIDAKGDLVVGTGADTFSRLAAGTNTYVLTADSAEATGLKWAAPAGGSTFVGCKAYKSANQTLSNATATMITFDSEFFDTDAIHSTSTNTSRFTVPAGKGGKWQLSTTLAYDANSTGFRQIRIVKNGTNFNNLIAVPVTADGTHMSHTDIFELVATDYIELQAYQNSGGNLSILSTNYTTFSFIYLGA
jgi:hypothetical protein